MGTVATSRIRPLFIGNRIGVTWHVTPDEFVDAKGLTLGAKLAVYNDGTRNVV